MCFWTVSSDDLRMCIYMNMLKAMNRKRWISMVFLLLVALMDCTAQTGMRVDDLFKGKVVPRDRMVEVKARGKSVSKYRLSYYHSLKFLADEGMLKRVEQLVEQDAREAIGSELREKGERCTHILFLKPNGKTNRFLCMLTAKDNRKYRVTMVYMEGSLDSMDELRKLLK